MTHPPAETERPSSVVERLADEMGTRWESGDRPLAEDFLARHPALADDPEAALDLIAEELALREEFGEPVSADAMAGRFPHLAARIRALVECQRAIGPRPGPAVLPAPGDDLGEFRLLAELGRGAVGRVFLAAQLGLGQRPVVLKVTPDRGHEHLSLARLQHTHIVPLYSAHDFPDRGLRALCLPYFGGATLSDLAARAADRPAKGGDLVAALRHTQAAVPVPTAVGGPACGFLEKATFVEAVCWIGACLADALQYAHDRGVLHLDLKPSNVLLAADGVPMLLDFHLARPPLRAGDPPPTKLGGTPGFMAPELEAAVRAVRSGTPVPAAVDGRADVYSLGVLLAAALRPAGAAKPRVPTGVSDILARCTAADAADRYGSAAALAADLRRHLADLPLKSVRNRSVVERWRKWRRRRPLALPLLLAVAVLVAGAAGWAAGVGRQAERGREALADGDEYAARQQYPEAVKAFRAGEVLIEALPFQTGLRTRLQDGRRRAERALAVAELRRFVDRMRPLYGTEAVAPGQVRAAAAGCQDVWDRRDAVPRPEAGAVPGSDDGWRYDLLDLGILTAHLGARAAAPEHVRAAQEKALTTLAEAESLFGPSAVLHAERATHARSLGLDSLAEESVRRAEATPLRSAWEHVAVGRQLQAGGDYRRAAAELFRALALEPGSPWANYHLGLCSLHLGEPTDAVAAFTTCLDHSPQNSLCWYNRGLAFADAERFDRARADFDQALKLDPGLTAALLARAVTHSRGGQFEAGFGDIRKAEAGGANRADVEYHRASVHLAKGDRRSALASLRAALGIDPDHRPSRELMARLTSPR